MSRRRVRASLLCWLLSATLLTGCGGSDGTPAVAARSTASGAECRAAVELARGLVAAQTTFSGQGAQAQLSGLRSAITAFRVAAPALPAIAADLTAMTDSYTTVVRDGGLSAPGAAEAAAAAAVPTDRVLTYLRSACPDAAAVIADGLAAQSAGPTG